MLAAVCWALGLSIRATSQVLRAYGITLSHLRVWREAWALASQPRRTLPGRPVLVRGVDGTGRAPQASLGSPGVPTGSRLAGQPVRVVAIDLGSRQPVALARLDERDAHALTTWLSERTAQSGVDVVVTAELASSGGATVAVCQPHRHGAFPLHRQVGRALRPFRPELERAFRPLLERVAVVPRARPPMGGSSCWNSPGVFPPASIRG